MLKWENKVKTKTWHSVWKSQKSPCLTLLWVIMVMVKTQEGVWGAGQGENSLSVAWGVLR